MKQFNKREKIYIGVLVVLVMVMCVKSLWLDPYTPADESEIIFVEYVENALEEQFDNPLYTYHILTYRIVDVGEVSETEARLVEHYDPGVDEKVMLELKGSYKAKVRKYLLGLLPVGQETVRLINNQE